MQYTRDDCLDALEAAIDELGHVPTKDEYNTTEGGPHASTISTHWVAGRMLLTRLT
ncbi:homing endonuclease associated repeat-containing protein [Halobacterium hubeiense]|uniref:homing endonuclease associated repeat-containing protein n=1 Tax=Halobacterium hubeiense TaxID=1407499 RepID=UPI00351EF6FA